MGIITASIITALIIVAYIRYNEYINNYSSEILIDVNGEWKQYNPSLTYVATEVCGVMRYEYVLRFRNLPKDVTVEILNFYVFIEPYENNKIARYEIHTSYFWNSRDFCFRITYSINNANKPNGLIYISGKDCVITNAANEDVKKLIEDFVKGDGGGLRMKILPSS